MQKIEGDEVQERHQQLREEIGPVEISRDELSEREAFSSSEPELPSLDAVKKEFKRRTRVSREKRAAIRLELLVSAREVVASGIVLLPDL